MNTQQTVAKRIIDLCWQHDLSINGLATISAVPPSRSYVMDLTLRFPSSLIPRSLES